MAADGGIARDQLRAFIERIERMEDEKKAISADIKEIYGEAKGNGFDVKVLREIVKMRKQDANERAEHEAILELYLAALGMIPSDDDDDSEDDSAPAPAVKRSGPMKAYNAVGFEVGGGV